MGNVQLIGTIGQTPYLIAPSGSVPLLARTIRYSKPAVITAGIGTAVALDARSCDGMGRVTCTVGTGTGVLWTLAFNTPYSSTPLVELFSEGNTQLQVQPTNITVNGFAARLMAAVVGVPPTVSISYICSEFP